MEVFSGEVRAARRGPGGIGADQLERQRDEFVIALGHVVEHEVLEHAQVEAADALVAFQRLAVGRVDAGGVDADELHAHGGEPLDGGGRIGRELRVPVPHGHGGIGAHEHALRHLARDGVRDVLPLDQRPLGNGVDHPARAEEGRKVDKADGAPFGVVVQRRIGMRADVGRELDLADVDRAVRRYGRGPALLVGRVAGEHRRAFMHGRRDVPEAELRVQGTHGAKLAPGGGRGVGYFQHTA